jgi:hypothetical protein
MLVWLLVLLLLVSLIYVFYISFFTTNDVDMKSNEQHYTFKI